MIQRGKIRYISEKGQPQGTLNKEERETPNIGERDRLCIYDKKMNLKRMMRHEEAKQETTINHLSKEKRAKEETVRRIRRAI